MFYKKNEYKILKYQKSQKQFKKYDAILENRKTKKIVKVSFGDTRYENYRDKTGLNLYTIHNDPKRRLLYKKRHLKDLKDGYYSPGWFSYYILW